MRAVGIGSDMAKGGKAKDNRGPTDRHSRLGDALRANLRRRKGVGRTSDPAADSPQDQATLRRQDGIAPRLDPQKPRD
ncbi:MAG: hypothetical protein WBO55_17985 [Rhizobiaceae bacterium]